MSMSLRGSHMLPAAARLRHRRDVVPATAAARWRGGSRRSRITCLVEFHTATSSPTVACVVSVTRAFARGGLLALRLRADFVVTEAMVVVFTGRQPVTRRWGGQRSRGSRGAVAVGSRGARKRPWVAWRARSGGRAPGVGTALGFAQVASVYMPLAPFLPRLGIGRCEQPGNAPALVSTPARTALHVCAPREAAQCLHSQNAHAPAAHESRRGQGPAAAAEKGRARRAAPPPPRRRRR